MILVATCSAQVMQQPGTLPDRSPVRQPVPTQHYPDAAAPAAASHGSAPGSSPADAPAANHPSLPPSLLDKPPEAAHITLNNGVLAIHADNSSLSAILHHLASSGMSIDGFQQDQRVFGSYGPGNPREVLSGLLQDAGYNFLMVGITEQGTPRQILLTARTGGGATGGPAQPANDDQPDDNDDSSSDNNNSFPPEAPDQAAPVETPASPPPNSNGRVKSPAEIIQELQRMRQQQQNPQ